MSDYEKKVIEREFQKLNSFLKLEGLEVSNHCEFVSILRDIKTGEVVAELCEDNEIHWN